jgi:endonuclease/exonuclease/phosphatase family metal-dependent hydrolase
MKSILFLLVFLAFGCQANAAKVKVKQLTFVTYNVLADPVGKDSRIPQVLALLDKSNADIIALQEVAGWFLADLVNQKWVKEKGYNFTKIHNRIASPGGQLILSKFPIKESTYRVLPGRQRRTVLLATILLDGRQLSVATTHMESYLEDGPIRARQLDAIFPLLKDADDAVFLGDFNFGDGEQPDSAHLDEGYQDIWLSLHPKKPGYTWNIEVSKMAQKGSFPGEASRRIDRILVRSPIWQPKQIEIIGDKPVVPGKIDLFPSDHFGLVGVLERAPK